ncbi:MAG: hypothetical protein MUC66_03300 [Methanolinea sp.]|nr:hypothetical protein [Methanolinea sp.]
MYPIILAGLTGIFGKGAIHRSLSARVAGFLYGLVVAVGILLGAAWDHSGDVDGTGRIIRASPIQWDALPGSSFSGLDRR